MAEAWEASSRLYENLIAAGCGQALPRQRLKLIAAGKKTEGFALLAKDC